MAVCRALEEITEAKIGAAANAASALAAFHIAGIAAGAIVRYA